MTTTNIPKIICWLFAIISILLALAPGINQVLFNGPPTEYRSDVAILTATLLAVVTYVYWTFLAVTLPIAEKKKLEEAEKTALATALLSELQFIDKTLRGIYVGGIWSYDPLEYPFLELASKNLHLFKPNTVHALGIFFGRLRDLRKHLLAQNKLPDTKEFLLVKAQMTCTLGCDLVRALREEGGIDPPPLTEVNFNKDNLPQLPDQVFLEPEQVYTYDRDLVKRSG